MGENLSFIGVDFWTALFTLGNFLAVFFIGRRFLWGPVMKVIADRQKDIDDMYTSANRAEENAKAMEAEYQQKISGVADTSEKILQDALIRGQKREDEIIRQAKLQAEALLEKASADIRLEKKKALNDAKDEISSLALAIAAKVVERELNSTDHDRLVNQFINELDSGV